MPDDSATPGPVGQLFPAGGPVRPELVIGRTGEIDQLAAHMREGLHTMLVGPRRTGKTTVCAKVCSDLATTHLIVRIEVPERSAADELLRMIVARCQAVSTKDELRAALRAGRPWMTRLLKSQGVDLDLSQLAAEATPSPREILELPIAVAQANKRPMVLFLDEIQRVVDYAQGEELLLDLVDLYSAQASVVLLVDGSDERVLGDMLHPPVQFSKLCRRVDLSPTIPRSTWRAPLQERFQRAGLTIEPQALERLLEFGDGRPYPTMIAAAEAALKARMTGGHTVGTFDIQMGIDHARTRLRDDDV